MSDDRKKPLWPWIVALLIGLPVFYVASFGPACWWFAEEIEVDDGNVYRQANVIYWPIGWVYMRSTSEKSRIRGMIEWYATRRNEHVLIPTDHDETCVVVGGHH
jgi:hypothetical protein